MENKRKHLEFLQLTITRMNVNSFLLKGWTITLIAALFALAAKDANSNYILIAYIIIPTFWILDGYFISVERRYRYLYDEVRAKDETNIDFDMNHSKFNKGKGLWIAGVLSYTLLIFYGLSSITTLLVKHFLNR